MDFDTLTLSRVQFALTIINLLIIAGLGMPYVLAYTAVTYWVFRKPGRRDPDLTGQPAE